MVKVPPPAAAVYWMVIVPVEELVVSEETFAVDVGSTRPELSWLAPAAEFSDTASLAAPAIASPSATRVRTM